MKKHIISKIISLLLTATLLICNFSLFISAYDDSFSYLRFNQVLDEEGNWVHSGGYYNPKWKNYNCYAFAINRVEEPQFYESYHFRYSPGDICGVGDFIDAESVEELAEFVRLDLLALGYSNVQILDEIPQANANGKPINESEELICLRRQSDEIEENDYHFMQYDYDSNAWYHKPGDTAVLKYVAHNGIPENGALWISEYCNNEMVGSNNEIYESDIKFIKYSKLQLNALWNDIMVENITVNPQNDVIYEITVDESDFYDITLSSQSGSRAFNYEIYSYNKFTGDYIVIESGSSPNGTVVNESVYLTKFNEYDENIQGWELNAYKHYIRIDYGKEGSTTNLMNVSIEHSHTHNHYYSYYSQSQHKAYCECSMYELQAHNFNQFSNITSTHHTTLCICGAVGETKPHYEAYGEYYTKDWHYVYCECGYILGTDYHTMVPGWKLGTSRCTVCGYIRNNSGVIEVIKGIEDEAETE